MLKRLLGDGWRITGWWQYCPVLDTAATFNDALIHEFRIHKLTDVFNYIAFQTLQALKKGIGNLGCKTLMRPGLSQNAKEIDIARRDLHWGFLRFRRIVRRLHRLLCSGCLDSSWLEFELECDPTVLVHLVHIFRDFVACNFVLEDDDVSARVSLDAMRLWITDDWCSHNDTYPSTWDILVFLGGLVWIVDCVGPEGEREEDRNAVRFALK